MSWSIESILILRSTIGDVDDEPTYTDNRLEELLLAAAVQVVSEVQFNTEYSIDFDQYSVSPDPTASETRDNAFISLVVLKAACLLARGEAKVNAGQSISIKDGRSAISTTDRAKSSLEIAKGFCEDYTRSVWEYKKNGNLSSSTVAAIISPYKFQYDGNQRSWR